MKYDDAKDSAPTHQIQTNEIKIKVIKDYMKLNRTQGNYRVKFIDV